MTEPCGWYVYDSSGSRPCGASTPDYRVVRARMHYEDGRVSRTEFDVAIYLCEIHGGDPVPKALISQSVNEEGNPVTTHVIVPDVEIEGGEQPSEQDGTDSSISSESAGKSENTTEPESPSPAPTTENPSPAAPTENGSASTTDGSMTEPPNPTNPEVS